MQMIDGKKYYTVDEAAKIAGVSVRTLRRWLSSGRLSEFLFPFRADPNGVLYRLEAPEEGEPRNSSGEYVVAKPGKVKGGACHEGGGS